MNQELMKKKTLYSRFLSYRDQKRIERNLRAIDHRILSTRPQDIPELFEDISLDLFGELSLDVPPAYPNIKAFLPAMPPQEDQNHWTGNHGRVLLKASLAGVKSITSGYYEITGKDIKDARVLDFGCGWGRLIRLLYKFVSYEQIHGVDPSKKSIEVCREYDVRANLAVSDFVPRTLPFDVQFDLIIAFSVFTHLSERTCTVALSTLRNYISDDGLLVITIRPREYWSVHKQGAFESEMFTLHDESGFAFIPNDKMRPIDGEITYGDTSISIDYFKRKFPQWSIVKTLVNKEDPYQILMFLRPM